MLGRHPHADDYLGNLLVACQQVMLPEHRVTTNHPESDQANNARLVRRVSGAHPPVVAMGGRTVSVLSGRGSALGPWTRVPSTTISHIDRVDLVFAVHATNRSSLGPTFLVMLAVDRIRQHHGRAAKGWVITESGTTVVACGRSIAWSVLSERLAHGR
ncbi:hypothetical protein [Actinosynnema sp. ALI-1.44]|uniref:hypothetical protein n=1 Tax=Actinosynnema sp. ALI-1.44 TaxID=1933779 RepID=UPI00117822B6|nr:hypothetical protein [Actinosynnema sp. ALI-1.44]